MAGDGHYSTNPYDTHYTYYPLTQQPQQPAHYDNHNPSSVTHRSMRGASFSSNSSQSPHMQHNTPYSTTPPASSSYVPPSYSQPAPPSYVQQQQPPLQHASPTQWSPHAQWSTEQHYSTTASASYHTTQALQQTQQVPPSLPHSNSDDAVSYTSAASAGSQGHGRYHHAHVHSQRTLSRAASMPSVAAARAGAAYPQSSGQVPTSPVLHNQERYVTHAQVRTDVAGAPVEDSRLGDEFEYYDRRATLRQQHPSHVHQSQTQTHPQASAAGYSQSHSQSHSPPEPGQTPQHISAYSQDSSITRSPPLGHSEASNAYSYPHSQSHSPEIGTSPQATHFSGYSQSPPTTSSSTYYSRRREPSDEQPSSSSSASISPPGSIRALKVHCLYFVYFM
jgi:hypothetical protein